VQFSVRPVCAVGEELLALMESASWVPFHSTGYNALNVRWVVPAPGLTGSPSHRIALATSKLISFV
jgi:hypothetical protein